MSFSVRNSNEFTFNDLSSNALYLQPLAAGWKSGSTTAGNALNTVVLNASQNFIPSASTQSNAFFVAPVRSVTQAPAGFYPLAYDTVTKEVFYQISL